MGYFSNGTEGSDYESRYCRNCSHYEGCPIWLLHLMWNYDARGVDGDETKANALDVLIPMDGTANLQCNFYDGPDPATVPPEKLYIGNVETWSKSEAP